MVLSFERVTETPPLESESRRVESQPTVAVSLVQMLRDLGVNYAFGVSGGAIAPIWAALENSDIDVLHFRHEAGAAFAATEAYFASDRPIVIFTTAGPGITNALTGLFAARWEGAKVICISPSTSPAQRGRWAFQETSSYTVPLSALFASGTLFHYATAIESAAELPEVARRLALGLSQPGGFVAHVSVPTNLQSSAIAAPLPKVRLSTAATVASNADIAQCAQLLSEGNFAIWVGFGARHGAESIRQLAERTGSAVMCSPRGKGIFPENHPQFIGVTGFGGHMSVLTYMQEYLPQRILVLGTRLGEFTSFWNPLMVPEEGFIHVDLDPTVPGTAYPEAETFAVQCDVGMFVRELLHYFPEAKEQAIAPTFPQSERNTLTPRTQGLVRPEILMQAIQQIVIDNSNVAVITEAGNSFAWGTHTLRFAQPGRYRVSTGFGSMGHAATGVLGMALTRSRQAVALLGDGAMLMSSEISTAVQHKIPAVWIVLNDSRYNMCAQGMALLGLDSVDTTIPSANFAAIARGMGADGICVAQESEIEVALEQAMASTVPFVIDVAIDPSRLAPIGSRIQSLISQDPTELIGGAA